MSQHCPRRRQSEYSTARTLVITLIIVGLALGMAAAFGIARLIIGPLAAACRSCNGSVTAT